MQSQSQIEMNYKELFDSLIVLHEDLDQKLTKPQFDDDLDVLRTVFLKVALSGPKQQLKPLASLTKTGDYLPAKITYLTQLLASKMEERGTSTDFLEDDLEDARNEVRRNQGRPKALAEAQEALNAFEFIKSVSYALQSAQQQINNQAVVSQKEEVKEQARKDTNLEALMSKWVELYEDEITDINFEKSDAEEQIQNYRNRNKPRFVQEYEDKLALILQIIEAQNQHGGEKPQNSGNQSDQEKQKEKQSLMEQLEVENLEQAESDLEYENRRRLNPKIKPQTLQEVDLRISQLKRLIELFKESAEITPVQVPGVDYKKLLNELCLQEEVNTLEQAKDDLSFKEDSLSRMRNNTTQNYRDLASSIENLKRIIELFDKVQNLPGEDDQTYNPIDYANAMPIEDVDQASCTQEQALERATNAMDLYKEMPECFQMSLTKLIYFSTLLLYGKKDEIFKYSEAQMREQIGFNLGSLFKRYKDEGYDNQEVKQFIMEIQNSGDSNEELQNIIKNLNLAQSKHRFFNFKEFQQLLSLNEKAAEQLKDQNIILLLGSTGCGKSTTVHYLCGSKMKETQNNDLKHIGPTLLINEVLKKVRCSPLAKSETRYVTPIEINLAQLGLKEDQIITLVDTPGSQDTESHEVDISNQYGILRAVRQTKGVRLAILFSYLKLGSRGEDIKGLISFYAGMFKSLDKDILKSFSFFFTHVPHEIKIENLRAILQDGYNLLTDQERLNDNLVALFQDIVEKAASGSPQVRILRPLDGEPIKLHLGILQSELLQDNSSFVERIDEKGKFQVLQQFKLHGEAIISAIKRDEGKYAIYLLEELIRFQNVFPSEQVFKNNIKLIVGEVIQKGQQMFKLGMQSLEKAFKVSQNNNLTNKDLETFKDNIRLAKSAIDPFYNNILTKNLFLKNKGNSNGKIQSLEYIEYLRELIEESLDIVVQNQNNLAHTLWNRYLQKYLLTFKFVNSQKVMSDQEDFGLFLDERIIGRLLSTFKQGVVDLTIETKNILQAMSLTDCNIVDDYNNKSPIQQVSENLSQLVSALNLQNDNHFSELLIPSIQGIQDSIKDKCKHIRYSQLRDIIEFIDKIKRASEQIDSEEEKKFYEEDFFFEVKQSHVENITNYFLMQQNLSMNLQSITGIDSSFLDELENDIIDLKKQFLQFYFRNEDKLKSVIRKKGSKHGNIKKVYDQIQQLRRVPFIETDTFISYNDVIKLLENLVEDKKQLVTKIIPDIDKLVQVKGSRISSPLSQLEDGLRTIMILRNFLPESNEFFLIIVDDLIDKLTQLADNLKMEAQLKTLSLEDIKQIKELDEIYMQLNEIQKISQIIDKTREIPNIQVKEIRDKIEEILAQIEAYLQRNQNSPDKILINRNQCTNIEQMLVFFQSINKETPLIKIIGLMEKSKNLQNQLIQYIEQNGQKQLKQFKDDLGSLKFEFGLVKSKSMKEEDKKIEEKDFPSEGTNQKGDEQNQKNIDVIEIQVSTDVKNICDILKTFKEAKKYPELNQYFDHEDIENKMLSLLRDLIKELGEQMKFLPASDPQFNINTTIVNNLCVLDSYMETNEKSFKKIRDESIEKASHKLEESLLKAQFALADKQYQELNDIIAKEFEVERLTRDSSLKKIQSLLNKYLNELNNKVNLQLKTINNQDNNLIDLDDKILEIIDILQQINEKFMDKSNSRKLQVTLEKFYRYLNDNAEKIKEQSQGNIKNKKYYDAYKIINQTLKMLNKISLDSTNQEDQENIKKLVESTAKKVIELQNQFEILKKKIQEETINFGAAGIKPIDLISMNAKKICDDLDLIIKEEGQQSEYASYLSLINKSVFETYTESFKKFQEIIDAKDKMSVSVGNRKEISDIKISLTYISDHLKEELMKTIVKIEEQINQKIEQISKKLSEILSNTEIDTDILKLDFENLSNQLLHRKNNLEADVKEKVDQQCLKMVKQFDKLLDQEPINQVFQKCLFKFFDIKSSQIQVHLKKETKDRMAALELKIMDIFIELFQVLNRQLQSIKNQNSGSKSQNLESKIKSPHLNNDKFLVTFQTMLKIPIDIQSKLYPEMKQKISQVTQTAYEIFVTIQKEFDTYSYQNKFQEAIQIVKLHKQNQLPLMCFKDQSYVIACTQLNDPELQTKVQFFNQYSIQLTYIEKLKWFFEISEKNAREVLSNIYNKQYKKSEDWKQDFQTLQQSLETLDIFSQNNDLFSDLKPKEIYQKIFEDFQNSIIQIKKNFSIEKIKQYFSSASNEDENKKLKKDIEFFIEMKSLNQKDQTLQNHFEQIQSKVETEPEQVFQDIVANSTLKTTKENVISQVLNKLEDLKEYFNAKIQKILTQYQSQIIEQVIKNHQINAEFMKNFSAALISSLQGSSIIQQHQILSDLFKVQKMSSINEVELKKQLNEYFGGQIIDPKRGLQTQQQQSNFSVAIIADAYKQFQLKYNICLKNFYDRKENNDNLVGQLKSIVGPKQDIKLLSNVIQELLPIIFSIYSANYLNPETKYRDFDDFKRVLYQPQPEYIIGLFRMFGKGYSNKQYLQPLFNNIIDMDLNEESGIMISVAASIFALYGYNVNCACANKFICIRETQKYSALFSIMNVSSLIKFRTLTQICENFIKSSNGTQSLYDLHIQDAYNQKIFMEKPKMQTLKSLSKKVMLINNIEFLCSIEFQQWIFDLIIQLGYDNIHELISKVMEKPKEKGFFDNFISKVGSLFTSDSKLKGINENFHEFIKLALEREIKKDQKINGPNQKSQNDQKLMISIGQFLLSEIPINYDFGYIMGLTSNFAKFNQYQLEIVQKYNIKDFTIIPAQISKINQSVQLSQNITFYTEKEQFQEIQRQIQDLIKKKAPIIVIFDRNETIQKFCEQIKNLYSITQIIKDGVITQEGQQLLTSGHFKTQVNLMTREEIIGIDFKILNCQLEPNLGLHIIQAFVHATESEQLNIIRKASFYMMILSNQTIQKQQENNESLKYVQKNEMPTILQNHQESMNYRQFIFKKNENNKSEDSKLQEFLIQKNDLFKEPPPIENIQSIEQNSDQVSIVIIIENTYQLNKFFFNQIIPRLGVIFKQQKLDNKIFKFDAKLNLLSFKIYFLGTTDQNIQTFQVNNQKDLEELDNQKEMLKTASIKITDVLSRALKDVNLTQPNAQHIVFIGAQSIEFKDLAINHLPNSLPPIYSYFMNDVGGQNFYDEFQKICREGKKSKHIYLKNQINEMLDLIQYDISNAIFLQHQEKIDEKSRVEYKTQLKNRIQK